MNEHEPHENHDQEPTNPELPAALGSVLQLQNTIEAVAPRVAEKALRDLSPTERIAVHYYPEGASTTLGEVSHISLSDRLGDTGQYATSMNYMVLRDGEDETTTRITKRPPFDTSNYEKAVNAVAGAEEAERAGLFEVTDDEVQSLTRKIAKVYGENTEGE